MVAMTARLPRTYTSLFFSFHQVSVYVHTPVPFLPQSHCPSKHALKQLSLNGMIHSGYASHAVPLPMTLSPGHDWQLRP